MKKFTLVVSLLFASLSFGQTKLDWTKQIKNLPTIDVREHGAVCDDTTDDTVAVQAAIDAASGVAAVLIPPKTCRITDTLLLPDDTTIIGTGWNSTLHFDWFDIGVATSYFLNADAFTGGNNRIAFYNFSIVGNGTGAPSLVSESPCLGIYLADVDDIEVSHVRFHRIPSGATSFRGVKRVRIVNNLVYESSGGAFHSTFQTGGPQEDILVANNTIFRVGDDGISVHASDGGAPAATRPTRISITGNTILGWDSAQTNARGAGIITRGTKDISITGNVIDAVVGPGIWVGQDDSSGVNKDLQKATISGNAISRTGVFNSLPTGSIGIRALGVSNVVISNNTVSEGVLAGISIDGVVGESASTDIIVSGNIVSGHTMVSGNYGIALVATNPDEVSDVSVLDNIIHDNAGGGIINLGATNTVIEGNVVYDNGSNQTGPTDVHASGISISGQNAPDVVIRSNKVYDTRGTPKQTYGISFFSGAAANVLLEGNDVHDNETGQLNISVTPTVLKQFNNRTDLANTDITFDTFLAEDGDAADSGSIRLLNNSDICWESSPAGTDRCIKFDATEFFQVDNVLAAPVFVTTAADIADSGAFRLGNAEVIAWEASPAGDDITLGVDSSEFLEMISQGTFATFRLTAVGATTHDNANLSYIDDSGSHEFRMNIVDGDGQELTVFNNGDLKMTGSVIGADSTNVASATTTALGVGNLFHITGTTAITTLNTCDSANNDREVTLIFDGILTFTDGNNLKLAGNFSTTADDTITLICDGTNWYEKSRSVN